MSNASGCILWVIQDVLFKWDRLYQAQDNMRWDRENVIKRELTWRWGPEAFRTMSHNFVLQITDLASHTKTCLNKIFQWEIYQAHRPYKLLATILLDMKQGMEERSLTEPVVQVTGEQLWAPNWCLPIRGSVSRSLLFVSNTHTMLSSPTWRRFVYISLQSNICEPLSHHLGVKRIDAGSIPEKLVLPELYFSIDVDFLSVASQWQKHKVVNIMRSGRETKCWGKRENMSGKMEEMPFQSFIWQVM